MRSIRTSGIKVVVAAWIVGCASTDGAPNGVAPLNAQPSTTSSVFPTSARPNGSSASDSGGVTSGQASTSNGSPSSRDGSSTGSADLTTPSPSSSSVEGTHDASGTTSEESVAQPTEPSDMTTDAAADSSGDTGGETITNPDASNLPMTIWIAGDSTVANGNTPCPTGWGKHLAPLFDEHTTIRNSAAGGRSIRTWMYNVTTEMGNDGECVLEKDGQGSPTLQARWQDMLDNMRSGDAFLIQFGINDGSPTCDRHVGIQAFKDSHAVLAEAARQRGVQPVFLTPVSAISCNGNNPQGSRGGYVDATLEIGATLGVPVLDLHARSVARYAELGFCPVAGGDVTASTGGAVGDYFCDDHTHFSGVGAADIAALVVDLLEQTDVTFTSHLKKQGP